MEETWQRHPNITSIDVSIQFKEQYPSMDSNAGQAYLFFVK
jgi:hypothetical protein